MWRRESRADTAEPASPGEGKVLRVLLTSNKHRRYARQAARLSDEPPKKNQKTGNTYTLCTRSKRRRTIKKALDHSRAFGIGIIGIFFCRLGNLGHICSLKTLGAFYDFEGHLVTFVQGFETLA
jgi:hypothetical protein